MLTFTPREPTELERKIRHTYKIGLFFFVPIAVLTTVFGFMSRHHRNWMYPAGMGLFTLVIFCLDMRVRSLKRSHRRQG